MKKENNFQFIKMSLKRLCGVLIVANSKIAANYYLKKWSKTYQLA